MMDKQKILTQLELLALGRAELMSESELDIAELNSLYVLFRWHFKSSSNANQWFNRDRLIMPNADNSSLVTTLFTFGFLDYDSTFLPFSPTELKSCVDFINEYNSGCEVIGNAIGIAIAETVFDEKFSAKDLPVCSHRTFAMINDDIIDENALKVSEYAVKFALDKITIICTTKDFHLYDKFHDLGWDVHRVDDFTDINLLKESFDQSVQNKLKPSIIFVKTSKISVKNKRNLQHELKIDKNHLLSNDFYQIVDKNRAIFNDEYIKSKIQLIDYAHILPSTAKELKLVQSGKLLNFDTVFYDYDISTYECFIVFLKEYLAKNRATVILSNEKDQLELGVDNKYYGAKTRYGTKIIVDEPFIIINSIANGLAMHQHMTTFVITSTSELDCAGLRVTASQHLGVKYMVLDDSSLTGGKQHSVEGYLNISRQKRMPTSAVFKPCDSAEMYMCFDHILRWQGVGLMFVTTGQLNCINKSTFRVNWGAYFMQNNVKNRDGIIYSSGLEMRNSLRARKRLIKYGFNFLTVSVPCVEVFKKQTPHYCSQLKPNDDDIVLIVDSLANKNLSVFYGKNTTIINVEETDDINSAKQKFSIDNIVKTIIDLCKKRNEK